VTICLTHIENRAFQEKIMNIQLEYKNTPVSDYNSLIESYPKSEFDSPFRSTVPFLYFWKNIKERLDDYLGWLGLKISHTVTASFEFLVDVQRGKGRPSQTDLMVIFDEYTITIEAKYTEPRYECVQNWLRKSQNRILVLEGWLDLIHSAIGKSNIKAIDIVDLPYQLIHRCASACFPNVAHRTLIYQCFDLDQEKEQYYKSQLQSLNQILNKPDNLNFIVLNIPLLKSSEYIDLQNRWNRGERKMYRDVIRGMKKGEFIEFGNRKIIRAE